MESRTLLTQIIIAAVDNPAPAVGDTLEIAVNYNFTGADRIQSQGVNVQMHFNPDELEFKGFKTGTFEIDGKVEPVDITNATLQDDTVAGANADGDPNTTRFIRSAWNAALGDWPGSVDAVTGNRTPSTLPGELYVATFQVKAGFDGEAVNFTGTPQGGQTLQGTTVQLIAPGGPTQSVSPVATPNAVAVGDIFDVAVPYDISMINRNASQGLNVQMHFNSQELEFVGFKPGSFELDGKFEPSDITNPVLGDDTAAGENNDGDANTDKFVKSVWNVALANWPATTDPSTGNRVPKTLPSLLYIAQFRAKAGFDGETIRFSGTPQGGAAFLPESVVVDVTGGPTQVVSPTTNVSSIGIGQTFEVSVPYSLQEIARLASQGLNVQMHFNNSELQFMGFKTGTFELDGKVEPSDITNPVLGDDTAAEENKDGDANTDKFVKSVWNVALGNWPASTDPATGNRTPKTLPSALYVAVFKTRARFDGETINFTGTPQGGARFEGQSVTVELATEPSFDFDIDGNGVRNAFQDGVQLYAWMLGSLISDADFQKLIPQNASPSRNTVAKIKTYLNANRDLFDVDGNGTQNAFQDGVQIYAWMLGTLISNADFQKLIPQNAATSRDTVGEIKDFLQGLQDRSTPATEGAVLASSATPSFKPESIVSSSAPKTQPASAISFWDSAGYAIAIDTDDEIDSLFEGAGSESSQWQSMFGLDF